MALVLTVNGESVELAEVSVSLEDFLRKRGLRGDRIAVERNGEIVPRQRWADTPIGHHDRLEIVHFVGGGTPVSR